MSQAWGESGVIWGVSGVKWGGIESGEGVGQEIARTAMIAKIAEIEKQGLAADSR
jgi:hypothetical protein